MRFVREPTALAEAGDQGLGRGRVLGCQHGCPRTQGTAKRALHWAGVAILTELVVVAVIAAVGLLAGARPGDLIFWALGVGLCFATPACVSAAVVIGHILREEDPKE